MKTKQKIFFAKLIFRIISKIFSNKRYSQKKKIFWNLNLSEAIDLHIFIFGVFEKEITKIAKKLNLNRYNQIIDIGANFGIQSLQFAQSFKNLKFFLLNQRIMPSIN